MLTLYFDGLFRCAPDDFHLSDDAGVMCYGWVIFQDGNQIARGHGGYVRGQDASSNVAEYLALIEGMEALVDMKAHKDMILVCGDAKSIIEQMQGIASVSANSIKPLYRRAAKLARQLRQVHWKWTPRQNNMTADALTRRALLQINASLEQYEEALTQRGRPSRRLQLVLDLRMYQSAC